MIYKHTATVPDPRLRELESELYYLNYAVMKLDKDAGNYANIIISKKQIQGLGNPGVTIGLEEGGGRGKLGRGNYTIPGPSRLN